MGGFVVVIRMFPCRRMSPCESQCWFATVKQTEQGAAIYLLAAKQHGIWSHDGSCCEAQLHLMVT